MRKSHFRRALSLLLAAMMLCSAFTVIPVAASTGEYSAEEEVSLLNIDTYSEYLKRQLNAVRNDSSAHASIVRLVRKNIGTLGLTDSIFEASDSALVDLTLDDLTNAQVFEILRVICTTEELASVQERSAGSYLLANTALYPAYADYIRQNYRNYGYSSDILRATDADIVDALTDEQLTALVRGNEDYLICIMSLDGFLREKTEYFSSIVEYARSNREALGLGDDVFTDDNARTVKNIRAAVGDATFISSVLTGVKVYLTDIFSYEETRNATPANQLSGLEGLASADLDALTDSDKLFRHYIDESVCLSDTGTTAWLLNIPEEAEGMYGIRIEYYPVTGKNANIEKMLLMSDTRDSSLKVLFDEARTLSLSKVWKYGTKTENADGTTTFTPGYMLNDSDAYEGASNRYAFAQDTNKNDLRYAIDQCPEWRMYECSDAEYSTLFRVYFSEGEHRFALRGVRESALIKSISLFVVEDTPSYADYYREHADALIGVGSGVSNPNAAIRLEGEFPDAVSDTSVFPANDRSSAITSPSSPNAQWLNIIGGNSSSGSSYNTAGQWAMYSFTPNYTGLYNIVMRYKQNALEGLFVSRSIKIWSSDGEYGYTNGGVRTPTSPFAEASQIRLDYSKDWQVQAASDGNQTFSFYFKEGVTYELYMEVGLGQLSDVISRVEQAMTQINDSYLNVLKLTGSNPDEYRDYGFNRIMPATVRSFGKMSAELYSVSDYLKELCGTNGSHIATLDNVAFLLAKMADEDQIAENLSTLKSYIGTLGTWINQSKAQSLALDYIQIQPVESPLPQTEANFFESVWFEVVSFFRSFTTDYNSMGVTSEIDKEATIDVWLATGRDQSQIWRTLITNDFTSKTGIAVTLKLVTANTLLPSVLSGRGPDVYIGLDAATTINYAIRNAIADIQDYDATYQSAEGERIKSTDFENAIARGLSDAVLAKYPNCSQETLDALLAAMDYRYMNGEDFYIRAVGDYDACLNAAAGTTLDDVNLTALKNEIAQAVGQSVSSTLGVTGVTAGFSEDARGVSSLKVSFPERAYSKLYNDFDGVLGYDSYDAATNTYYDAEGNSINVKNINYNYANTIPITLLGKTYGVPETTGFSMLFYRKDILSNLNIAVPRTWDDLLKTIPVLQQNNMSIGLGYAGAVNMFLYQMGGTLWKYEDDPELAGAQIGLDSKVAYEAFDFVCRLYTDYSFPISFDASNRFRTGEIPMVISDYVTLYNTLTVFATEIRGLWEFTSLPGVEDEATGLNNCSIATVTATVMLYGADSEHAWTYLQWQATGDAQASYGNEMVALVGPAAKYATANIQGVQKLSWTASETEKLLEQFENLAAIPNYPGSYIITRYVEFAFRSATNDDVDPVEALENYISPINDELTRKREEFGMKVIRN